MKSQGIIVKGKSEQKGNHLIHVTGRVSAPQREEVSDFWIKGQLRCLTIGAINFHSRGPEGWETGKLLEPERAPRQQKAQARQGAPSMTTPHPITALAQSQGWKLGGQLFLALMTCWWVWGGSTSWWAMSSSALPCLMVVSGGQRVQKHLTQGWFFELPRSSYNTHLKHLMHKNAHKMHRKHLKGRYFVFLLNMYDTSTTCQELLNYLLKSKFQAFLNHSFPW